MSRVVERAFAITSNGGESGEREIREPIDVERSKGASGVDLRAARMVCRRRVSFRLSLFVRPKCMFVGSGLGCVRGHMVLA